MFDKEKMYDLFFAELLNLAAFCLKLKLGKKLLNTILIFILKSPYFKLKILNTKSSSISNLFDRLFGKQQVRNLMLGLDGAGKTTILYQFKLGQVITTIPTVG